MSGVRIIEKMYIAGEWTDGQAKGTFPVYNPATGEVLAHVPDGGSADAAEAIAAAAEAFPAWSTTTSYERAEILDRAYRLMMERSEELARLMTMEQGKPLTMSRNEVAYGASFFSWYAEEAKRIYGETIPSPRANHRFLSIKHPVGVVAAITPWNYPMSMITRKIAPALAAGCTVVLKPAEQTPLCAAAIFDILHEAGVPAGVVNMVTALDPEPIGKEFMTNPLVKKLTFTGSTEVGKILLRGAADQVKRVSVELGGHAPFIVLPDADPVHAAKGAVLNAFLNSGQACICANRIFVHRDILEPFTATLIQRVSSLKVGNGLEEGVQVGPLVDEAALAKMVAQTEDAVSKGARLVCGGTQLTEGELGKGTFFAPTVLLDVNESMRIYREETFGPIAPVIPFSDEDDVLAMANDTTYGLAAYVYTRDLSLAWRMWEGLEFGIIGINDINPSAAAAPFGGMKESGIGREGGREGIEAYLETKLIGIQL